MVFNDLAVQIGDYVLYWIKFAGPDDKSSYHESNREFGVLNRLQDFLSEMRTGFLFERRQHQDNITIHKLSGV